MTKSSTGYKVFYHYAILFVVAVAVYANTFKHNFVLDDDIVFRQNRYVQEGVSSIPDIISHGFLYGFNGKNDQSYRPLVTVDFAIEKSLFGNKPGALHKMQVMYYAILCCLLFGFLHQLFKKQKPWIAFWVSLLFALHPIHTEVVANIKGRDEIFQAIFLLISLRQVLLFVDEKKTKYLLWSLVCYFLALLSKEMAVTYIALLPLTLWFFRSVSLKKLLSLTSFHFAILFIYFLLRSIILDTITFDEEMTALNNGLMAADNLPDRIATAFYIFANYIKLLFYPSPLSWDYSYPTFPIVSFTNPVVILTVITLVVLVVISILKLSTKNKYAYLFLFFIISFSVVSNFFILIGSTLGERFLFFPSVAFCLFVVWAIHELLGRFKKMQFASITILLVISALYAIKTVDRNKDWESNTTLFVSGAESTPNNSRAIGALGSVYMRQAEESPNQTQKRNLYLKAIESYQRSIELLPSNSDSYYNLGVIYMNTGQNDLAMVNFKQARTIAPKNIKAINNLGAVSFSLGNYNDAKTYFEDCLTINPQFQQAVANLGAVYHNLGQTELAKQYYIQALELNPNDQKTRKNLSLL